METWKATDTCEIHCMCPALNRLSTRGPQPSPLTVNTGGSIPPVTHLTAEDRENPRLRVAQPPPAGEAAEPGLEHRSPISKSTPCHRPLVPCLLESKDRFKAAHHEPRERPEKDRCVSNSSLPHQLQCLRSREGEGSWRSLPALTQCPSADSPGTPPHRRSPPPSSPHPPGAAGLTTAATTS